MIEFVFSFILSTWSGLGEVHSWADQHIGGQNALIEKIKQEEQVLCTLERQGLLVYDGQWKTKLQVRVPSECLSKSKFANQGARVYSELRFRSETLPSVPSRSCWDQRIEIQINDDPVFSVSVRQDKQHIGVHSTEGWSMWIERKTGHLRYEMVDFKNHTHFRLKAQGNINPLKGDMTEVRAIEALHTREADGKVIQAHTLNGKKGEGYYHVNYAREASDFKKTSHKCSGQKNCAEENLFFISEKTLNQFAAIHSKNYKDFVADGRPLAFDQVVPEQQVPPTSMYR